MVARTVEQMRIKLSISVHILVLFAYKTSDLGSTVSTESVYVVQISYVFIRGVGSLQHP